MSREGSAGGRASAEECVSEFVRCAAEELKTPVTSILGYVELLSKGEVLEDAMSRARVVQRLRRHVKALSDLSEALTCACRAEERAAREVVEVGPVIADAAAAFGQSSGVEVVTDIAKDAAAARCDRRGLSEAFTAMLRLACWDSPSADARITMRACPDGIEVVAAGVPVPRNDMRESRPALSEWVVRRAAARHGGSVEHDAVSSVTRMILPVAAAGAA